MQKKKTRSGQCIYCGRQGEITEDHIPPESLFAKDDRRNLIKVPCCRKCHSKTSRDDEYFKLALTLREDVSDHPDIKQLLPSVLRSLRVPQNVALKAELLKTFRQTNPRTSTGLLLPAKPAYTPNINRLERVIERITKGLFYHEKKQRLPDDHEANGFSFERFVFADGDSLNYWQTTLLEPLSAQRPRIIGRDVFSYRFLYDTMNPDTSVWFYLFYQRVPFIGLTLPKEERTGKVITPWSLRKT